MGLQPPAAALLVGGVAYIIIRGETMDTIAAIATGNQVSAIGIVRVSGPDSIALMDEVFAPADGRPMSSHGDRQLVYGKLCDGGRALDYCLCTISRAPRSYTGEDTAELQCHGSPVVLGEALSALFKRGARQAGPGEFTKRAFLNGRMDLTEAEAVIDIIDAESAAAAENAAGQLAGAVTRRTDAVYDMLTDMAAHFGAALDYPDEDIEPFELDEYARRLEDGAASLGALEATFERGRVLREGLRASLIGRPNVGKSSLMNALLGYERAIVTSEPGTTRDTIEEKAVLGGVLLRITDTAGLRDAGGEVERLGVRRALDAAENSELVIAVFDGSQPLTERDSEALAVAGRAKRAIAVVNKSDLPRRMEDTALPGYFERTVHISARTGEGIDALGEAVREMFPAPEAPAGEILTNARQAEAVSRALDALIDARAAILDGVTPDAVLTECERARSALGELNGRSVADDVTERIFSRFCVGK